MKKIITFLLLLTTFSCFASQKLTVLLDWFPNPNHAPLYVAQQQGFFTQHGLEVKLIGPADPTDPPKLVAAGKAEIAVSYEPQFMQQVDRDLPLIRIGTLINKPLNCLVTLKSSHIDTLAGLKNKKIGTSTGDVASEMLDTMLEKQGLTSKDVEVINVRYNLSQALLSGKVDAVTGMMRNFEVPQIEMTGHAVQAFYPEDSGIPNYDELIFVTRLDHQHDPRIKAFLAALQEGVAYLKQHPQTTWTAFAKQFPENNNALNQQAWMNTLPYFAQNPAQANIQEWLKFANFMQAHGLIRKVQPIQRYVAYN